MLKNKTIFIAHAWHSAAINEQSVALAKYFSLNNKVIYLSSKKKGIPNQQINDNLSVLEWKGKRPVTFKDFVFAYRLMRKYKPYLLISNFAANDIMMFAGKLCGVENRFCFFHTLVAQHIFDHGGISFWQRARVFRKGFAFRAATKMIASSSVGKSELVKYYHVNSSQISIFPNAISQRPQSEAIVNFQKIGYMGRLPFSKGVDILVNAMKKIVSDFPNIILEIVGEGSEEENLKKQVIENDLTKNITFIGAIAYEKIFKFLAELNFLIIPSRIDNFPTIVLNALSCGTPVIGSNAGGIADMVVDGYNGFLFEIESVDELREKMLKLLNDKDLRNIFSTNAITSFKEHFDVANYPERFEKSLL